MPPAPKMPKGIFNKASASRMPGYLFVLFLVIEILGPDPIAKGGPQRINLEYHLENTIEFLVDCWLGSRTSQAVSEAVAFTA